MYFTRISALEFVNSGEKTEFFSVLFAMTKGIILSSSAPAAKEYLFQLFKIHI